MLIIQASQERNGRHLIIDATAHRNLSDRDAILDFCHEVVRATGLHRVHEFIKIFPNGHLSLWEKLQRKPRRPTQFGPGITYGFVGMNDDLVEGIVVLSESHMTIHTIPEERYIHFDLFSCREFDVERVVDLLRHTFKVIEWRRRCVLKR
jgi:hypothetical protein